jgi:hypothetical protein
MHRIKRVKKDSAVLTTEVGCTGVIVPRSRRKPHTFRGLLSRAPGEREIGRELVASENGLLDDYVGNGGRSSAHGRRGKQRHGGA